MDQKKYDHLALCSIVLFCRARMKYKLHTSWRSVFSYQQVAVAAETDPGALHPLQVDVRVRSLHVPETALQGGLLREQGLQPEKRWRQNETMGISLVLHLFGQT